MKVSAEVETFRPGTLIGYAALCGWTLARAHAKAGDAAMIAGYLGSKDQFDNALAKYCDAYADQAERDFEAFQAAIRAGRLSTEPANLSLRLPIVQPPTDAPAGRRSANELTCSCC